MRVPEPRCESTASPRLFFGGIRVDLGTGALVGARPSGMKVGGRLRPFELALLARLYAANGGTVPRERLLSEVWGYAGASASRAVDATMARLRARLEPDPAQPRSLLTDHGRGYVLARLPPPREGPLVGRAGLLERIGAWIAAHPGGWLTLGGAGGIGKSRVLEALAGLPRAGLGVVYVDVEAEGIAALAVALDGAAGPRLVLADLGALPAAALAELPHHGGPSTVVAAGRAMLDRRGEAVLPVPPLESGAREPLLLGAGFETARIAAIAAASEGLPLALHLARRAPHGPTGPAAPWLATLEDPGAVPRHRSLAANRRSTLDGLTPAARRAWESLPHVAPDDALLDELVGAWVVGWAGGRPVRAAWIELATEGVW